MNMTFLVKRLAACPPPLFEEFIDSSVSGGLPQREINTLEQCQGQCAANNDCLAVDWDASASTQCWFHLNRVGSRRDSPGVVHYALVDRCPRRKSNKKFNTRLLSEKATLALGKLRCIFVYIS